MHTPGPWTAHTETGSPPFLMKEGESSGWIAQTCTWMGLDEAKANAHLMSAAPYMLTLLRSLRKPIETELERGNGLFLENDLAAIDTAIAIATGCADTTTQR